MRIRLRTLRDTVISAGICDRIGNDIAGKCEQRNKPCQHIDVRRPNETHCDDLLALPIAGVKPSTIYVTPTAGVEAIGRQL